MSVFRPGGTHPQALNLCRIAMRYSQARHMHQREDQSP